MSKVGKCHICGQVKELTREHVPPQSVFNKQTKKVYGGEELIGREKLPWDFSDLKGEQHQGGVAYNRLCESCNNNTGLWYVPAYKEFCEQFVTLAKKLTKPTTAVSVTLHGVYPLRVIKEVLSMLATVNNKDFLDALPNIRELILDKSKQGLDKIRFMVGMYVNTGGTAKYVGYSVMIVGETIQPISEISSYPFGFVLLEDPTLTDGYLDITDFLNDFTFADCIDLKLVMPVRETNTVFPGDYRTKSQVLEQRNSNRND